MKLNNLQIDDSRFTLNCELGGEELKSMLELFPEVKSVASLVDGKKQYAFLIQAGQPDERELPRIIRELGPRAELPPEQRKAFEARRKAVTEEERFIEAVVDNVEPRGDWVDNPSAREPRMEQTMVSTFHSDGVLKSNLEPWRELIERQVSGIENPGLASVALLSRKSFALAENNTERTDKKNQAITEAVSQLREIASQFYHETIGKEEHVPEGASDDNHSE